MLFAIVLRSNASSSSSSTGLYKYCSTVACVHFFLIQERVEDTGRSMLSGYELFLFSPGYKPAKPQHHAFVVALAAMNNDEKHKHHLLLLTELHKSTTS